MSARRTIERKRITAEVADQLVKEYGLGTEAVFGENGLMKDLTRAVLERVLDGELTHHLGYSHGKRREERELSVGSEEVTLGSAEAEEPGTEAAKPNCRNGRTRKRVMSPEGALEITVPRDREGSFEPLMIRKGQRRFAGFDQRIIAMYA